MQHTANARCCIVSGVSGGNCFIIRMTGADKTREEEHGGSIIITVLLLYILTYRSQIPYIHLV